MQITETSAEEYGRLFVNLPHIYNSVEFSELNRHKAESLHYLLFKDTKVRFGIVLGERNGVLYSPFSAPFGGFTANRHQQFDVIDDAAKALSEYAKKTGKRIVITLPPLFYDEWRLPCIANALSRVAKSATFDVNYHFCLSDFANYDAVVKPTGKNKLRQAMKEDFQFYAIDRNDTSNIARAYDIIRRNRAEHDYQLRMSYEDVMSTIKVIPADFFLLTHNGTDVAAAQVFHTSADICQVIYWGDLHEYSHLRSMNYLACRIFEHYYQQGLKILDIGPSTDSSVPNYGLCSFKESLGCRSSLKFTFEI